MISVRNTIPQARDTKTFSIHAPQKTHVELADMLKEHNERVLKQKFAQTVQFDTPYNKKNSHLVIVIDKNKKKSKSFAVKYHQYGSHEISRELKKFLCGGTK